MHTSTVSLKSVVDSKCSRMLNTFILKCNALSDDDSD